MDPHFDATEATRRIAAALSAALAEEQDLGEGAASFRQVARAAVGAVTGRALREAETSAAEEARAAPGRGRN